MPPAKELLNVTSSVVTWSPVVGNFVSTSCFSVNAGPTYRSPNHSADAGAATTKHARIVVSISSDLVRPSPATTTPVRRLTMGASCCEGCLEVTVSIVRPLHLIPDTFMVKKIWSRKNRPRGRTRPIRRGALRSKWCGTANARVGLHRPNEYDIHSRVPFSGVKRGRERTGTTQVASLALVLLVGTLAAICVGSPVAAPQLPQPPGSSSHRARSPCGACLPQLDSPSRLQDSRVLGPSKVCTGLPPLLAWWSGLGNDFKPTRGALPHIRVVHLRVGAVVPEGRGGGRRGHGLALLGEHPRVQLRKLLLKLCAESLAELGLTRLQDTLTRIVGLSGEHGSESKRFLPQRCPVEGEQFASVFNADMLRQHVDVRVLPKRLGEDLTEDACHQPL